MTEVRPTRDHAVVFMKEMLDSVKGDDPATASLTGLSGALAVALWWPELAAELMAECKRMLAGDDSPEVIERQWRSCVQAMKDAAALDEAEAEEAVGDRIH